MKKTSAVLIAVANVKAKVVKVANKVSLTHICHKMIYALSFYRSQNVLGWSNFFVPDQKFLYILWQSQTFCARQEDDLNSVKLVFMPAQKFLKRH